MTHSQGRAMVGGRLVWAAGLLVAAGFSLTLVVVAGGGDEAGPAAVAVADPALAVPIVHFDGSEDSLGALVPAGQPMVVNFFASWCAPCLAELPEFEEVHQDMLDEVTFVGLNLQDSTDSGLAVIDLTGITYEVARDLNGEVFSAFEALGMPTTVFVDGQGQVVEVFSGVLTRQALEERIEEFLL